MRPKILSVSAVVAVAVLWVAISSHQSSATEIQLADRGAIFTLPVTINGSMTLHFMVDTGTPAVVIPDDVASTLVHSGTIRQGDFLPGSPYRLTDGTVLKSSRFNIHEFEIGGVRVDNVACSIDSEVPELVLGEDLLNRFETWELDNNRHVLILGHLKRLMVPQKDISFDSDNIARSQPLLSPLSEMNKSEKVIKRKQIIFDVKQNRFGSFHYQVRKVPNDDIFKFNLMVDNRSIFTDESYMQVPPLRLLKDTPSSGCQSAITSLYSGGAHCCTTAILLTICGEKEKAFSVDVGHGSLEQLQFLDLKKDGSRQISVPDFTFSYYNIDDQRSLSFADSPICRRLLVFDGARWAPDSVGEHPRFYRDLLQKTERGARRSKSGSMDEGEAVSSAIIKAYYALMAGESDQVCQKILATGLPRSWQGVRTQVHQDIKSAVSSFQPVKPLY